MSEQGLRVLVVDDERAIRRLLRAALTSQGHTVIEAETAQAGISAATSERPDLIILDLGLPDLDGLEVVQRVREWSATPIIVLSVRSHEDDKIAALDAGADDYITKPFATGELAARMRVAVRHATHPRSEPIFRTGELTVDLDRRVVLVVGREIDLTPVEYGILKALIVQAGKVLTHGHLLAAVWGPGYQNQRHLLQVNVSNLRRKLEADPTRPRYVVTEPGVGYRLTES
ncbi:MAG TPA: response regulator [bacterium]|nr:response regulator [bacterium]